MEDDKDMVQMFEECAGALTHFTNQHISIHRHALRYHKNAEARRCHEILQNMHTYLDNPQHHTSLKLMTDSHTLERIEEYLAHTSTDGMKPAGPSEWVLLKSVIQALTTTKTFLLESMTVEQLLELANNDGQNNAVHILAICEHEKTDTERKQSISTNAYNARMAMTEENFRSELVKIEYDKNKNLNKFEQSTDQQIRDIVEAKFEHEWEAHRVDLQQMYQTTIKLHVDTINWKKKVEALQKLLTDDVQSADIVGELEDALDEANAALPKASTEHPDKVSDPTVSEPQNDNQDKIDWNQVSVQAWKQAAHNALIASARPSLSLTARNRKKPAVVKSPEQDHRHHTVTAQQTFAEEITIVRDAGGSETPSSDHTPGSIPKCAYEYDFNKENSPVVSPPSPMKESLRKAFIGLDLYARGLFARSPSIGSHKTNDDGSSGA